MNRTYLNGREVLPPDVLAEVQKHASGLIWIPSPKTFFRERRQLILTLREQGVPTRRSLDSRASPCGGCAPPCGACSCGPCR